MSNTLEDVVVALERLDDRMRDQNELLQRIIDIVGDEQRMGCGCDTEAIVNAIETLVPSSDT